MSEGSVRVLQNEYVRRLHSRCALPGKLHKGQASSSSNASIPSKYQTLIIDNSDNKGFLSKTRRFNYDLWTDDRPGPGTYVGLTSETRSDVSLSRRGTGSFASKNARLSELSERRHSIGPSPNSYNVASPMTSRTDFNRAGVSSTFHEPIAVAHRKSSTGPAPNEYNVSAVNFGRRNNVHADAAFKSRTKREIIDVGDSCHLPSPCQYNVSDTYLQGHVSASTSSFKSKTGRQFPPSSSLNPGPGQYAPYEPLSNPTPKTQFQKRSYLCLSAPAMPLPAVNPPPGPGSYDVYGSFDESAKKDAKSSAFLSTTTRWSAGAKSHGSLPGPAHYNPVRLGKQSFIYNSNSRWI